MDRKVLLGGLYSVLAVLAIGGTSCSGPPSNFGYTERRHAPVSFPAVAADGSLYLINGPHLWHYAADGRLLSDTAIADPQLFSPGTYNSDIEGRVAAGGSVVFNQFYTLAALGTDGRVIWSVKWPDLQTAMFGPGEQFICTLSAPAGGAYVALVDAGGTVAWRAHYVSPRVALFGDGIIVLDTAKLALLGMDGREVWSLSPPFLKPTDRLLGGAGKLMINGTDALYALDDSGNLVWSLTPPPQFGEYGYFRDGLIPDAEKIAVAVDNGDSSRYGLLVLDGAGNQVALHTDIHAYGLAPATDSNFLSLHADGQQRYVGWHSAADGALLWRYRLPDYEYELVEGKGELVDYYHDALTPFFGANGHIYCEGRSTLFELDQSGALLRSYPGTYYVERWVEDFGVFPD